MASFFLKKRFIICFRIFRREFCSGFLSCFFKAFVVKICHVLSLRSALEDVTLQITMEYLYNGYLSTFHLIFLLQAFIETIT